MSRQPRVHLTCRDPLCGGTVHLDSQTELVCDTCGQDVPIHGVPSSRRPARRRWRPGVPLLLGLALVAGLPLAWRSIVSQESLAASRRDPAIAAQLARLVAAIDSGRTDEATWIPRPEAYFDAENLALLPGAPIEAVERALAFWNALDSAERLQVLQRGAGAAHPWFRVRYLPMLVVHTAATETNPWVANALRSAAWNAGYEAPELARHLLEYLADRAVTPSIRMRARTNAARLREAQRPSTPPD